MPTQRALLSNSPPLIWNLDIFAPGVASHYFPSLDRPGDWAEDLADVVDADRLFAATRPKGAEAPLDRPPGEEDAFPTPEEQDKPPLLPPSHLESPRAYGRLVLRAQTAVSRGDLVRACILLTQARKRAPEKNVRRLRSDVRRHIARLVSCTSGGGAVSRTRRSMPGKTPCRRWSRVVPRDCGVPSASSVRPSEGRLRSRAPRVFHRRFEMGPFAGEGADRASSAVPGRDTHPSASAECAASHGGGADRRLFAASAVRPAASRRRTERGEPAEPVPPVDCRRTP